MSRSKTAAPIVVFFLVAFGIPWATWISLAFLHVASPKDTLRFMVGASFCSVGGVAATYVAGGTLGLKELVRRCVLYRVPIVWWIYALFLPLGLLACASVIYGVAHGKVGPIKPTELFHEWWLFFIFVFGLFQGPLGEELGWRGFLLPFLLKKYSPLKASLILGLVWALWHLPSGLLPGGPYYFHTISGTLLFAASAVALSIFMTVLFLRTHGSVLLAIAMHWSVMPSSEIVKISFPAGQLAPDWLRAVVVIVVAAVVVVVLGSRLGATGPLLLDKNPQCA
jgi:membrane protease YdiL (CAAX protease family)